MSFMNIVLLVCDSPGSKYFSNILSKEGIQHSLIVEQGASTKKRKIHKLFLHTNIILWPLKVIDLIALAIYRKLTNKWLQVNILEANSFKDYPKKVPRFTVDYANSDESLRLLDRLKPDVMVIFGTSILKEKTIKKSKLYTLNIHPGIVPLYRNVHGDFWLLANKDYSHAGSTIMYVDNGIDTGEIAIQKTMRLTKSDNIMTFKKKLMELSGDMLAECLTLAKKGDLPRKKQDNENIGSYNAPTFFDFIRYVRNLLHVYL